VDRDAPVFGMDYVAEPGGPRITKPTRPVFAGLRLGMFKLSAQMMGKKGLPAERQGLRGIERDGVYALLLYETRSLFPT
jgi:hypothetical protein